MPVQPIAPMLSTRAVRETGVDTSEVLCEEEE